MERMKREADHPQSNIMKLPIIEETELKEVINNIRNGKAAGVDGIKSELMK